MRKRSVTRAVLPLVRRGFRKMPLAWRTRLAIWAATNPLLRQRSGISIELLRDLGERDPDAFHSLLWGHHLAYARYYEVAERFGSKHLHPSRRHLFADITTVLSVNGVQPATDVNSVLEVGCSLGYLLRFMEQEVFPAASILHGLDIDAYAVRAGAAFLRSNGSGVHMAVANMGTLDRVLVECAYDVVVCAGSLMYLEQETAARAVAAMSRHTRVLLALTGLAHPARDNAELDRSEVRLRDGALIHNLDAMVRDAGCNIVHRRWEGARSIDGNTIYFVLATPFGWPFRPAPAG